MTIAAGILLIAVGAILRFATNFHVQGIDMDTVGLILMIAGAAGIVLSFLQDVLWTDRVRRRELVAEPAVRRERVVERRPDEY
jgi:hypothetical protein